MKILNGTSYSPVGKCIYCGSTTQLSKEHILPFGLDGSSTLPKASCQDCAMITGETERKLLRGSMRPVRLYRNLQSRKKHAGAPTSAKLTLTIDGKEVDVDIPISNYPIILNFPVFAVPSC